MTSPYLNFAKKNRYLWFEQNGDLCLGENANLIDDVKTVRIAKDSKDLSHIFIESAGFIMTGVVTIFGRDVWNGSFRVDMNMCNGRPVYAQQGGFLKAWFSIQKQGSGWNHNSRFWLGCIFLKIVSKTRGPAFFITAVNQRCGFLQTQSGVWEIKMTLEPTIAPFQPLKMCFLLVCLKRSVI